MYCYSNIYYYSNISITIKISITIEIYKNYNFNIYYLDSTISSILRIIRVTSVANVSAEILTKAGYMILCSSALSTS